MCLLSTNIDIMLSFKLLNITSSKKISSEQVSYHLPLDFVFLFFLTKRTVIDLMDYFLIGIINSIVRPAIIDAICFDVCIK